MRRSFAEEAEEISSSSFLKRHPLGEVPDDSLKPASAFYPLPGSYFKRLALRSWTVVVEARIWKVTIGSLEFSASEGDRSEREYLRNPSVLRG